MMHDDEGDKSWEKGTCVDVIGLEPNAHSIPWIEMATDHIALE